jgi:hypothetical protein
MNQLLLGALLPFLAAAAWYARRGCRASPRMLVLTPLFMALAALYAIVPDLPRLAGCEGLYFRLANDPRMDIFLWHYTIDRIEVDSSLYHTALILMFAMLVAAAWRELYLLEKE